ncbi:flavin reductase family protein [Geodermatophilus ruber]|uniref:NADH-FMN oxidoreductase RutF, flavin reductase (DIM6/NTAB) family n=1 Tax=Geodermatophilus ruber TaxID=504800 RepID=A0A1I4HD17_9ACTN|nr:flavin reductase family protein [Geodermatophilus ruber]SFL39497.1 NADH-FMN oxidoreductase RutF, flavin reductase (DIM6/NTAB) family [Geodermatophilus ruber]
MTMPAAVADVDPRLLRRAMGQFATGVTVITTVTEGSAPAGCTVNAFTSLSLDPPLVLVCIGRGRAMHPLLTEGPGYAVNVLAADQEPLAGTFARPGPDRFAGVAVRSGRHGVPLLEGAIAHIECDRYGVLDGGDHAIVVGRVRDLHVGDGEPLLYSQGAFLDLPRQDWERATADARHEWLLSAPW